MRFDEPDDVGEILGLAYVVKGHDEIDVPIASRFGAVGSSGNSHHRRKRLGREKQPVGIARQFHEVPPLVGAFGSIVDAIEDHRHEGKRAACLVAIAKGLSEQPVAEPVSLVATIDSEPGKDRHRERPAGECSRDLSGEVAKINLPCREGVVSGDAASGGRQDLRC
jgi:hypothetical protein